MIVSILRWLTLAVSLAWFFFYFRGGAAVVEDNKRAAQNAAAGPRWLAAMILLCAAGLVMLVTQFLVCLGLVNVPAWGERTWMTAVGTGLVATGIAAEFWIRHRHLGSYWSGSIELREGHEVVERGPYRLIRHPLYAINLLIYPGAALVFPVWWNWPACAMVIAGYVMLAAYEDGFLAANLQGYRAYMGRTRYRFVPGVW